VDLLKEMFPLLRHKVRNLPSASLYMDTDERVCPNCGSTSFQSRGIQRNKTRAYRRFLCNECRSWFRGNTSISSAEVVSV
jgi:transposase-like protein